MTLSEKDFRKGRKNGLGVDPVNDSFTQMRGSEREKVRDKFGV